MLLLILLLGSSDINSNQLCSKKIEYLEQKKNPWGAVLFSWFIPSAGHFYAENKNIGILFLGMEITECLIIYKNLGDDTSDNDPIGKITVFLLVATRLLEYRDAYTSAKRYNGRLKEKLGLTPKLGISNDKIKLSLTYSF